MDIVEIFPELQKYGEGMGLRYRDDNPAHGYARDGEWEKGFLEINGRLESYLDGGEKPSDDIDAYFNTLETHDSNDARIIADSEEMLHEMRNKMDTVYDNSLERHSHPGTITMNLPFFYPLNSTVLGWYIHGWINASKDMKFSPEDKRGLGKYLMMAARHFDPKGTDIERNDDKIRFRLDLEPAEALADPPKKSAFKTFLENMLNKIGY